MRILHLAHQYLPESVGGVELYTHWLAHAQAAQGHQVAVFYRRSSAGAGVEQRQEAAVQVWAAWSGALTPSRRFAATFRAPAIEKRFVQALDEFRPDLVHVEHLMGHPTSLIARLRRRRIPFVVTLWDFWWRCANAQLYTNYSSELCPGPDSLFLNCARCALARAAAPTGKAPACLLAPLMAWRDRRLSRVLRAAAAILAPTPFVERWYAGHRCPRESLLTLSPGLERPAALPPPHRPADGKLRFLYVGGLSPQKGIHVLVEAFAGVQGAAELQIAGDESQFPAYVRQLRALADARVTFLGRLERPAVWQALVDADVVVVPSLWYETFSFLVSEGFIAGKPVLASRLGPLADRVRDGVDGLLLPPGDVLAWRAALQRLVDSPDELAALRQHVSSPLPLSEHVTSLLDLYARLIPANLGD